MNADAVALFRELADRSPSEREAYYAEHHIDAALRAEIESLVRYDTRRRREGLWRASINPPQSPASSRRLHGFT